jgi:Zn-dependent protease with chaperone function
MKERTLISRCVAVVLVALMCQPAWLWAAVKTPELPDPGNAGLTKQQQEQLGLKAAGEVYQQMPVLPDSSPVSQYVQRLGRTLVAVIPADRSWPYQFHVVQQKEINAFALPGGPIFINVGTITAAQNEAQLAGVMAHEMSHVYMQHSAKQMRQNMGPNILAGLGQILGQMVGGVGGAIASLGGQLGGGLLSMKYSRKDEAQADAVGAIIMYKAGYNPQQMAQFFQALEKEGGAGGPQFLSDHPNPGNRVEAVDKEIADWPPKPFNTRTGQFPATKQQAGGVKAYSAQEIAQGAKTGQWAQQNRKNGSIPANVPIASGSNGAKAAGDVLNVSYQDVRPSGSYRQLNQGGITMDYPSNWQAQSGQNGLTIAPPAGVGQSAIAYGVVVGAAQDQSGGSLDQATQALAQSLMQSNPGMQQSGGTRGIKVNGTQGRSVTLMGNSPVQQNGKPARERDWLVTLPDPQGRGGLIYMVFIAPDSEFGRLRGTYEHMLNSFRMQ